MTGGSLPTGAIRPGDSFTITNIEPGSLTYDQNLFDVVLSADGTSATFTAKGAGSGSVSYTAQNGETVSQTITVQAQSQSSFPLWLIIIGIVLVLAVVLIILRLVKNRRRDDEQY